MKHSQERLITLKWAFAISFLLPLIAAPFMGDLFIYIQLYYFLAAVVVVTTTVAFLFSYKALTYDVLKKHYFIAALIGYASIVIISAIMSVLIMIYLEVSGSGCGSLTYAQCYGTIQTQGNLLIAAIFVGVLWTAWNLAPGTAALCVWLRHRRLKKLAAC